MSEKKTLVIVESPSKGKTIEKYLGKDYVVKASFGHMVDLSKGGKSGIGVDIEGGFKPKYEIMPEKIKVLEDILEECDSCKEILLASDSDREGEAIAFHLQRLLESTSKKIKRVTFGEITKEVIKKAIQNTRDVDMNLVRAQEARRVLDRIVGFMASPFLIQHFGNNLSAGRVQSVAVRMIVDREKEIQDFIPEEYWRLDVKLLKDSSSFIAKCENKLKDKKQADAVLEKITNSKKFKVVKVAAKDKKEPPPPPLTTAKLQQLMAKKHGLDSEKTMKAAQDLYESGKCTYIRTDSVRASDDALKMVRDYLKDNKIKMPDKANVFKTKDSAQDAHECIRPTDVNTKPDDLVGSKEEKQVYKMIWEAFVASQMNPAVFNTLDVRLALENDAKITFKASGKALKDKGYLELYNTQDGAKIDIPMLTEGETLDLSKDKNAIVCEQKFTAAPPRFTQSSLLEELEKREIGRPATYAQIIKTISSRNYIELHGQSYKPTEIGNKITKILSDGFSFMDYAFTASMEKKLDLIAAGKAEYLQTMTDFYGPFKKNLDAAYKNQGSTLCEKCESPMLLRTNSKDNTKFFGCQAFPRCKNIKPYKDSQKS